MFPFHADESILVAHTIELVHRVLGEPGLRAREVLAIARLLLGLERLPHTTPGLSVSLTVSEYYRAERAWFAIELDGNSLVLRCGGSVYAPMTGSDSYAQTLWELHIQGGRAHGASGFEEWLDGFATLLGRNGSTVEVSDSSTLNETLWHEDAASCTWVWYPYL